jgi:hypothetical protein
MATELARTAFSLIGRKGEVKWRFRRSRRMKSPETNLENNGGLYEQITNHSFRKPRRRFLINSQGARNDERVAALGHARFREERGIRRFVVLLKRSDCKGG